MAGDLKTLMRRKHLSFRQLAFLTDLSAGFLCRIANGDRRPSKKAAVRIAQALGTSPGRIRP